MGTTLKFLSENTVRKCTFGKGWEWVQYTFAAVEAENGQMVTVDIESVRFLEAPHG